MTETYDAIVIGGRCAGSPTAMLLARQGYKVLVVDRSTFPSDSGRSGRLLRCARGQLLWLRHATPRRRGGVSRSDDLPARKRSSRACE